MAAKGDIFTVHEKVDAPEPSDRIVLVREGFALWAFVFNLFWLLYHRCWLAAGGYLILAVVIDKVAEAYGLNEIALSLVQLALQLWLAGVANDLRRHSLGRAGYREIAVVCAESPLLAERRFFDRQAQFHPSAAA
ncbi:MAG: hypothetical protein DI582_02680 [Azospirillum brasilense]|nr:MAG: hypothetical protein DI582_02680 [Azospirillum brasilense]